MSALGVWVWSNNRVNLRSHFGECVSRPKLPGWSPMTMTLSGESKAFLRVRAALKGTDPGKVADALIQAEIARQGRSRNGETPQPGRKPSEAPLEPSQDPEQSFYGEFWGRINAMGRRFATKLAKERRLVDRDLSGEAWRSRDAKERSLIGERLINAALRDIRRWDAERRVPVSQHEFVLSVLCQHENQNSTQIRRPRRSSEGFSL